MPALSELWFEIEDPDLVAIIYPDDDFTVAIDHPSVANGVLGHALFFPFIPKSVVANWGDGTKLDARLNMARHLNNSGLFAYLVVKPSPTGQEKFLPVEFKLSYDTSKQYKGWLVYP